jgi:hypothetical protein
MSRLADMQDDETMKATTPGICSMACLWQSGHLNPLQCPLLYKHLSFPYCDRNLSLLAGESLRMAFI